MTPILALLPHRTRQEFSLFFEEAHRFQFTFPTVYKNPISEDYLSILKNQIVEGRVSIFQMDKAHFLFYHNQSSIYKKLIHFQEPLSSISTLIPSV
jgi:hypothetical protein